MLLLVLIAIAVLAARIGSAADKVTLRLDWSALGYHAPFSVALERGYFKESNLDVEINEGKGSNTNVQLVGRGADTFVFADAAAAAKGASLGLPVRVVMGIYRRSMAGVVFQKGAMQTPADLKGKALSVTVGDGPYQMLPGFLRANNIPMDSVKLQSVDAGAKLRIAADKKVDGTVTYVPISAAVIEGMVGGEWTGFLFSDSGVNVPSLGLVANSRTIETQPDMVRRFVAAVVRGYADARRDPAAATAIHAKHLPQIKGQEASFTRTFQRTFDYFDTSNTAGKPFGWQSPEDWKQAAEIMEKYMDVKAGTPATTYYTNDFLPSK